MAKDKTATVRITLRLDLSDPAMRALHRIIRSSTPAKLGQIVQGAVLAALVRYFRTETHQPETPPDAPSDPEAAT